MMKVPSSKFQVPNKSQAPSPNVEFGSWSFFGIWNLKLGASVMLLAGFLLSATQQLIGAEPRLRLLVETDAGGDPDDEQSLVRFLLYANEWDVEGIIANRPDARKGENWNRERTGLAIVQQLLNAYGQCYTNLALNDRRYPRREYLWERTVPGYNNQDAAVDLIIQV